MGFLLEFSTVIRSDDAFVLDIGAINPFSQPGTAVFCDSHPIWLARMDWTALAEVEILAQARAAGQVSGTFRVRHAYTGSEQQQLTAVFRRMHAGAGDPNIYFLISAVEHMVAMQMGVLVRPSLESEGFLHAAPAAQLTRVANKHYRDVTDLRVLVVPQSRVMPLLRWEPAAGSLYPHLYGPLDMAAVSHAVSVPRHADGTHRITVADLAPERALAVPATV